MSTHRSGVRGRQRWLVVLVLALAGALASTAFAAGWLTDSTGITAAVERPTLRTTSTPNQLPARAVARPAPITKKTSITPGEPMTRSVPTRLRIPGIGVDSGLMALGLAKDGTLETPPGAFPAGWFTGAPTPGELGPAIIVGHVRYGGPGVFARLAELRSGDEIKVKRASGATARFRVTRVQSFAKSAFPTEKVYGNLAHAGLRLITCGGFNAKSNEFDENVVVFAELMA